MRVLHTVASLDAATGGPARSVPGLAEALGKEGIEVHIWSPETPVKFPEASRFSVHRGSLDQALADIGKPDVIHDHGLWLPINHRVAKVARARGIPRILSPRGMLEPWALNHKKWKKKLAWWTYQRADIASAAALHATADSEAQQFERLGLSQPIHVIPNGVDAPPYCEGRPQHSDLKTLLFLGRIHPKKGLSLLVDAWKEVRPKGWRMRVVGSDEGGHRKEIEELVEKANLQDEWSFDGEFNDSAKWECYQNANLFILPSYSENFGIAVAEALACGLPVITTTGTPWKGLIDRKSGWWVNPTASDIAAALHQAFTSDAGVLSDMGSRGREWIKQDFMWKNVALMMTQTYKEVLSSYSHAQA